MFAFDLRVICLIKRSIKRPFQEKTLHVSSNILKVQTTSNLKRRSILNSTMRLINILQS